MAAWKTVLRTYLFYYAMLRPLYYLIGVFRIYLETPRTFSFAGRTLQYFHHWHGMTYLIERIVEVPIVWDRVRGQRSRRVLEVGNCLKNYFPSDHDVLDKYDQTDGVIHLDVVEYRPRDAYDLIVSISTIEHVGWDEHPRDPNKGARALDNLFKCLAPAGEMVVTWPLGYNPHMDRLLRDGHLHFTETYFMKRVSWLTNRWRQVEWSEVEHARYGSPFRSGNAVVIGIVRRAEQDGVLNTDRPLCGVSLREERT